VFQRVTAAHRLAGESADSKSEIRNPRSSSPGLWSELRFRLRRPLGILTGTIDKLLITPAASGGGFDVEIIDFKTNRFRRPSKPGAKRPQTVAAAAMPASGRTTPKPLAETGSKPAQGLFNFEAISEEVAASVTTGEVVTDKTDASIEKQIETVAHDYQLQMQSYALALRELLPKNVRVSSLRATLHFIDPKIEVSLPDTLLEQEVCAGAIDEAMLRIATLDGTLDAEFFPTLPATHCRICNFLELCPAGREWLKRN
jgi:PD-(D/E)XK nuclease superfamily